MKTVLLTAIGGDIAQNIASIIKDSSLGYRLIGCDMQTEHAGGIYVQKVYSLPSANNPEYVHRLDDLIRKEKVDIVMPLSEAELEALVSHFSTIQGPQWITPGTNVINAGLDKLNTIKMLQQIGLPTPWTVSASDHLPIAYPCIFKSRKGSGSKNLFTVYNEEDALYLRKRFSNSIFQELLEPADKEVTCAVYRSMDNRIGTLQMLRRLNGGLTSWAKVIDEPLVLKTCEQIAESLDLRGSMNVQMRLTSAGPRVFEINPRYSSTTLMRHNVGFTDVLWALDEIEGKKIQLSHPPTGKILVRLQSAAILQ